MTSTTQQAAAPTWAQLHERFHFGACTELDFLTDAEAGDHKTAVLSPESTVDVQGCLACLWLDHLSRHPEERLPGCPSCVAVGPSGTKTVDVAEFVAAECCDGCVEWIEAGGDVGTAFGSERL